jgi:hypothetical protein
VIDGEAGPVNALEAAPLRVALDHQIISSAGVRRS